MSRASCVFLTLVFIAILTPLTGYAYGPHRSFRGGIWIGPEWGPVWVNPYPYYYSPPVVVQQPSVDYYIQQSAPQQSEEPAYWYYCRKPEGYYPYVKQCPDGWMKVVPNPPASK